MEGMIVEFWVEELRVMSEDKSRTGFGPFKQGLMRRFPDE
jgi:hypothetical protein